VSSDLRLNNLAIVDQRIAGEAMGRAIELYAADILWQSFHAI
jgi:hypothetical protein